MGGDEIKRVWKWEVWQKVKGWNSERCWLYGQERLEMRAGSDIFSLAGRAVKYLKKKWGLEVEKPRGGWGGMGS